MASGMLDIYLSSTSNKMNEAMKVLTIIATIFIPLGFIAGVYGMNFKYMPELELRGGSFVALSIMIAVVVSMLSLSHDCRAKRIVNLSDNYECQRKPSAGGCTRLRNAPLFIAERSEVPRIRGIDWRTAPYARIVDRETHSVNVFQKERMDFARTVI